MKFHKSKHIKKEIVFFAHHFALLSGCIIFLCIPAQLNAQISSVLDFKNMSIGLGMNYSRYDFTYHEVSDYENTDLKQSFLIDLRANFSTLYGFIFSPVFELWSWTDNSGAQYDVIQNGVNDYMFSFDISRVFVTYNRFQSYIGGGIGVHSFTHWTKFPRFNPYYQEGTTSKIRSITVHKNLFVPDLIAGLEYQLLERLYISTEVRREFSNTLKQWKLLMSISMFD